MKCCVSDSQPSLHGGSDLTGELSVVTVVSQTHSYKLRLFPFVSNGSFIAAADWRLGFYLCLLTRRFTSSTEAAETFTLL